jgi:hypothetical protein
MILILHMLRGANLVLLTWRMLVQMLLLLLLVVQVFFLMLWLHCFGMMFCWVGLCVVVFMWLLLLCKMRLGHLVEWGKLARPAWPSCTLTARRQRVGLNAAGAMAFL